MQKSSDRANKDEQQDTWNDSICLSATVCSGRKEAVNLNNNSNDRANKNEQHNTCNERVHLAANVHSSRKEATDLFDGGDRDDEDEGQDAGDGGDGRVNQQLKKTHHLFNTPAVSPLSLTVKSSSSIHPCITLTQPVVADWASKPNYLP